MSEALLDRALDELVPLTDDAGDWGNVISHAETPGTRRRVLLIALATLVLLFAAAVVLAAIATRTNVLFSHSKPAPNVIKKQFLDLSLGAPPRIPGTIASRAREVGSFQVRGKRVPLWVAPTRDGGFCYRLGNGFGGCGSRRTVGAPRPVFGGITFTFGLRIGSDRISVVNQFAGSVLGDRVASVEVEYKGGEHRTLRLIYVSKPIDAGFFVFAIPQRHWTQTAPITAVIALDKDRHILARATAPSPSVVPSFPPNRKQAPRTIPQSAVPPSAPLQHGNGAGVSVVAGANGVATFDMRRITPHARSLLKTTGIYACFRLVREFGIFDARSTGFSGRLVRVTRLRFDGVRAPFDGCEITGSWGHRWPDRNGSHGPVEVSLTPAGHRYFTDRAAARDLGLFVRSPSMRRIRGESESRLRHELTGFGIRLLRSTQERIPPHRIGYVPAANGVTLIEWSPTGRRFFVRIHHGEVQQANLKPYAWTF